MRALCLLFRLQNPFNVSKPVSLNYNFRKKGGGQCESGRTWSEKSVCNADCRQCSLCLKPLIHSGRFFLCCTAAERRIHFGKHHFRLRQSSP